MSRKKGRKNRKQRKADRREKRIGSMILELYDHTTDPTENVNVVHQPQYENIVKRFVNLLNDAAYNGIYRTF